MAYVVVGLGWVAVSIAWSLALGTMMLWAAEVPSDPVLLVAWQGPPPEMPIGSLN